MASTWAGHTRAYPSAMVHSNHSPIEGAALRSRLFELWERTGAPELERLAAHRLPVAGEEATNEHTYLDWVSTALMEVFKRSEDPAVFALLFELNRGSFLHAIQSGLRRSYHHVDAQDVLQEVFLNIYRYPHRFHGDKADAFRGWGHRIARNTLLKFLKGESRCARFLEVDDETLQPEDVRTRRPDRAAIDAESAVVADRAYVLYLHLYLVHFARLSTREREALTRVEVDGASYRDAANALGVRVENLKMVIFRGRRKIFRGMEASLGALGGLAAIHPGSGPRAAYSPRRREGGTAAQSSQM
jgi:RNA polymerase sigma factor (sigma-70 family)